MKFDKHPELKGRHAYLGASKYAWLNYDDDKLKSSYASSFAQAIGTSIHELAANLISHRRKINKRDRNLILYKLEQDYIPASVVDTNYILNNLIPYVSDAIDFGMETEVGLKYSEVCFGTTDAIQYYEKERLLRIHDLKTGTTPAHMEQLQIYEALFFLEYGDQLGIVPKDIDCELRIYQGGEIVSFTPDPKDTEDIMEKAIHGDLIVTDVRGGRY